MSVYTRSPLNRRETGSQGKKMALRQVIVSPVGSFSSHFARCVPVTIASSTTPCGPMTMFCSSKTMSGNAVSSSV